MIAFSAFSLYNYLWQNKNDGQPVWHDRKGGIPRGILKATLTAAHSVKEEMWREFFDCDTMTDDTILLRGVKRVSKYSANTRKDDC